MSGGRTIWHFTMSLDGFLADEHGALDWMPMDAGSAPMGSALVPHIGALLVGRRTYDGGLKAGGSGAYGGVYTGPVFVLTNRPGPPGPGGEVLLTAGLAAGLTRARQAAAGRDVVIFGAQLGQECLDAGELDELLIHIAPVLIGAGTPAFATGHAGLRTLSVLERSPADQLTTLRLAPR
jgi:dihydrofolate reductase